MDVRVCKCELFAGCEGICVRVMVASMGACPRECRMCEIVCSADQSERILISACRDSGMCNEWLINGRRMQYIILVTRCLYRTARSFRYLIYI